MSKVNGVIVTIAATAINLILGVLYIWSIMGKALVKELGWSATQASLPYTVCTISFAIVMVFAGKVQDSKGPRLSSTLGGFLLGGGLLLSSFVTNPWLMVLSFGVLGGAGIGFSYAATTPPAIKWFPAEKKGFVSGIVVAGVGFAAVYISPLINKLLSLYGISKTFFILGVGTLVIITLLSQLLINPPKDYSVKKSNNSKEDEKVVVSKSDMDKGMKEMLTTLDFYKLWIMFAFTSSAGLMLIAHIANIANIQANWENGYLLVVLLAIFNTLGRIVGGFISDKIGHLTAMRVTFLIQAVNMVFFSWYLSTGLLALGVAIAGFCYGALFSVFPAATAESYGVKNLGANYGLVFTAFGVGGVIGPMLAARIFDTTGSYNTSYIVSAALLIIAIIFTFISQSKKSKTPSTG